VTIEHRELPQTGPPAFATIYEDEYAGALAFEETLCAAFDRQQLLARSQEIEDRALRAGDGTLGVGCQSLSAFETQLSLYRRLGNHTDLDVHPLRGGGPTLKERRASDANRKHERVGWGGSRQPATVTHPQSQP
jgi:DICT domain-containing protein